MWNIVIEESFCTSGTRRIVTFLGTDETVARLSFSRGVQLPATLPWQNIATWGRNRPVGIKSHYLGGLLIHSRYC